MTLRRRFLPSHRSLAALILFCACLCHADPLSKDTVLPALKGTTLAGSQLELPSAVHGKVSFLVFSFTKASGTPARQWSQWFWSEFGTDPKAISYSVIFLENVPRLFRGWVASGIKKGIPKDRLAFAVKMESEEKDWQERLGVTDKDHAYLILLDPNGKVLELHHGPFAQTESTRLAESIRLATQ